MYTVKQLADFAGITVRTLHYYDEIDLLKPTEIGDNGYRKYDDAALYRLQQILFYREMGVELLEIKAIMNQPDFDVVGALQSHRQGLREKIKRLQHLVSTVDRTLEHLTGAGDMSKKQLFDGFSEEKQKDYERRARLEYGPDLVNESIQRWNSYSKAHQESIMAEGRQIYLDFVAALEADTSPTDTVLDDLLRRWHNNIRHFYEPTLEILRGLAMTYNSHPEFMANFEELHPDLPAYLEASITRYVDDLEYEAIERLLAEDESADSDYI